MIGESDTEHGLCIVVLDRGFVYVGQLTTDDRFLTIRCARNVQRYGTTRGLGQLALEGPQPCTVLNDAGVVKAPIGELKHWLVCEVSAWSK